MMCCLKDVSLKLHIFDIVLFKEVVYPTKLREKSIQPSTLSQSRSPSIKIDTKTKGWSLKWKMKENLENLLK